MSAERHESWTFTCDRCGRTAQRAEDSPPDTWRLTYWPTMANSQGKEQPTHFCEPCHLSFMEWYDEIRAGRVEPGTEPEGP